MNGDIQMQNVDEKDKKKHKRINNEVNPEANNTEQEKVVQKLKIVLDFFEKVQIVNVHEDSLAIINKPLDDLLSSLKYVPVKEGPCFAGLPVELKRNILSNSCAFGALVAANVCQEWKDILEPKLVKVDYFNIGMCCDTGDGQQCENSRAWCFKPEEMLRASIALGPKIRLVICSPAVTSEVDSKLLVDGLMSSFNFKIDGCCGHYCREDEDYPPVMTKSQIKDLFEAMEKVEDIHSVELRGVDMTHLDQDKLMDCLLKIETLSLSDTRADWSDPWGEINPILDVERFIKELLQDSTKMKLSNLQLEYLQYPQSLAEDLADGLCNVKTVRIGYHSPLRSETLQQLIKNVLSRCIRMESLFIEPDFDWRTRITTEDLKMFIMKLKQVELWGEFTREQVEAVRLLPGVNIIKNNQQQNVFIHVKILKGYE